MVHEGAELTELVWAPLDRAESYDLHEMTLRVVQEVRARIEAGLSRFAPVPLFHRQRGVWRRDLLQA